MEGKEYHIFLELNARFLRVTEEELPLLKMSSDCLTPLRFSKTFLRPCFRDLLYVKSFGLYF